MIATLTTWFWEALKLGMVAAGVFYAVCVLVTYAHTGPDYRLKLDSRDFGKSIEHFLIFVGVKITGLAVVLGKKAFDYFSEPSADVGDWLISKSPRLQHVVVRPPRP